APVDGGRHLPRRHHRADPRRPAALGGSRCHDARRDGRQHRSAPPDRRGRARPLNAVAASSMTPGEQVNRWMLRARDPDRHILLEKPGSPALSDEVTAQTRDLLTKGAMGLAFILTTDDCQKTYETLRERGVE